MTPAQDISWLERITPALHANIYAMYAALERIATSSAYSRDRDIAHDALNTVFAWRAPELSTAIAEEN